MDYSLPVMKGKFTKGRPSRHTGSKLAAHLKYAQYRKLGPQEKKEDRCLFSQEHDNVSRKDAVSDIMAHTANNYLYHSIILSPAEYERVDDFQEWTRNIMRDLEKRKGIELHWYAVIHAHPRENTNEPHVHLVLATDGNSLTTGQMEMVRMDVNDYTSMRVSGREHSSFEFYQEQQQFLEKINMQDNTIQNYNRAPGQPLQDMSYSLD